MATLLGLLLVVTYVANYLSNQLPGQMQANDLNHEILVENQLGRFGALLAATSAAGAIGAQSTQPLSLGSDSEPPFAKPDISYLSGPVNGTGAWVNYTTTGTGGNTVVSTPIAFGSGIVVHLLNSWTAEAEAAYIQGAVLYAQLGGTPIMVDNPPISGTVSGGALTSLSIWLPQFSGKIPGTSGSITTNLVSQLRSTNTILVSPATHLTIATGTNVVLTIISQYATAWTTFFNNQNWPGVSIVCSGAYGTSTTTACSGAYVASGALGRIVVTVPGTNLAQLSVQTALFSINAQ